VRVRETKSRLSFLVPDWNVPKNVLACTSMRQTINNEDAFSGFNLATHVDDDPKKVASNRKQLVQALGLSRQPIWLQQTHSTEVLNLDKLEQLTDPPIADAAFTSQENKACVIMTADCLPILIAERNGKGVLAIHAGWKGLANGIIQKAIEKFTQELNIKSTECCVWLGPAISQNYFEVGLDVYSVFIDKSPEAKKAFIAKGNNKFLCDIYHLARLELMSWAFFEINGGEYCTYAQADKFYSYRRHTHQLKKAEKNIAVTNSSSFLRADETQIQVFTKNCGRQATEYLVF